jgi:hypothetical protein
VIYESSPQDNCFSICHEGLERHKYVVGEEKDIVLKCDTKECLILECVVEIMGS